MKRRKKLTEPQEKLYKLLKQIFGSKSFSFEEGKKKSGFRSYDGSFSALGSRGYIVRIGIENEFKVV